MTRLIAVASGKGGVGKTTTTLNLGTCLKLFGKDVIIADAALTTPNLALHLGAPVLPNSLHDVLSGKSTLIEALYTHHSGTKILPASISREKLQGIAPELLFEIIPQLKQFGEIILIDVAAGLGREAACAIRAADEILIVTAPELPAITDALKTARLAEELGKPITGVVLTRVQGDEKELSLESIKAMLELPILGIIPDDSAVKESLQQKDVVVLTHPSSKAAKAYRKLAAELIGLQYEETEPETEEKKEQKEQIEKKEKKGLLKRLFGIK